MSAWISLGFTMTLAMHVAAAADKPNGSPTCREDAHGFCADKVLHYALSFDHKDPVIKINSAILIGTTIDVSPPLRLVREPTISAKEFVTLEGHTNWKTAQGGLTLKLRIHAPPKVDKNFEMKTLFDRQAKLELAFDCGITLLVTLKIVDQQPERDVARLVLSMPELEKQEQWAQKRVAELVAQWTTEFDARRRGLDAEVAARVPYERALAKLEHDECHELIKTRSINLVTVMTRKICRVGDQLELRFRLLNRNKSISFVVSDIKFTGATSKVLAVPQRGPSDASQLTSPQRGAEQSVAVNAQEGDSSPPSADGPITSPRPSKNLTGYQLLDEGRPAQMVHLTFNRPVEGIVWWPAKGSSKGALKVTDDTGHRSIAVPDISY